MGHGLSVHVLVKLKSTLLWLCKALSIYAVTLCTIFEQIFDISLMYPTKWPSPYQHE